MSSPSVSIEIPEMPNYRQGRQEDVEEEENEKEEGDKVDGSESGRFCGMRRNSRIF